MRYLIRTTRRRLTPLLGAFVLLIGGIGASVLFAGGTADAAACPTTAPFQIAGTACQITGTLTLNPGTLTLDAPLAVAWTTTITGVDQLLADPTAADQTYTVDDATGTAPGWHVTASATAFVSGANTLGTGTTTPTFSTNGSLSLTTATPPALATVGPGASCVVVATVASTCTLPTNTTTYPVAITTGSAAGGPFNIYDNSPAGSGVGTIVIGTYAASTDVTAPNPVGWWVNVPANTPAGSYGSTISLELISGP